MRPGALLIRADASVAIGTGHVMRCLALAQAWQDAGGDAAFAMAQSTPAIEERLRAEGVRVDKLRHAPGGVEDAQASIEAARSCAAQWIVVDGYQFGADYQRNLKDAGLKVLFVDDSGHAEHYPADVVLNQNAQANAETYRSRGRDTRLLLGPRYALLRREFAFLRNFRREIPAIGRKVLVTMGGSDPENLTLRVIEALALIDLDTVEATVVVGGSNPHVASLRDASAKSAKSIRVLCDVDNMAEWMKWADLAFSAAGSTCWEICFLGLPAILVDFAPNQTPVARELNRLGAALHLGDSSSAMPNALALELRNLMLSKGSRVSMSQRASGLVDGLGAERVASAIRGRELDLRRVESEDSRLLWEWANDPDVRGASFSTEPIGWNEHTVWFSNKLADEKCHMFIATEEGAPVGQIRLDRILDCEVEIDISVAREMRGLGYASRLIGLAAREAFRDSSLIRLHAFIRPSNQASVKAFEKANFCRAGTANVRGHEALHYILERDAQRGCAR